MLHMKQWFIQSGNEIVGPLSSKELRILAASGGLQPNTPVSANRRLWIPADSIPGLELKVPQQSSTVPEVSSGDSLPKSDETPSPFQLTLSASHFKWIKGTLFCLLLVSAQVVSWYMKQPRPAPPIANAKTPAQKPPDAELTATQIMGAATLTYWASARQELQNGMRDAINANNLQRLAGWIVRVENLPVRNVDPSATQTVLEVCTGLRATLQMNAQSKDPGLFLEAFARGMNGDPVGTGLELRRETKRVEQQLQAAARSATRMRVLLSQHYGIEFPALLD